jgi:2-methylcitrate dehydratase
VATSEICSAERPDSDRALIDIADYVTSYEIRSAAVREVARYGRVDALAWAFRALEYPAGTRLLGPVVPGATLPGGARVPGTAWELDPVQAALNIGTLVRWLDLNDPSLATEWGHPADNLGAILAVADYLSRQRMAEGGDPLQMREVLEAMIKAHEIRGAIALDNSANERSPDHGLLLRIAATAVATSMLGGSRTQVVDAIANAWIDGGAARIDWQAPNSGARKGWAAGDANSRGVRHALLALTGETGVPSAPTAPSGGFQGLLFGGGALPLSLAGGSEVRENVARKFEASVQGKLAERQCKALKTLCADQEKLEHTSVDDFFALLVSG